MPATRGMAALRALDAAPGCARACCQRATWRRASSLHIAGLPSALLLPACRRTGAPLPAARFCGAAPAHRALPTPWLAGEHGDLHVVLRTLPHPRFERRGDGLMYNETISLLEALVGFEREVGTLQGWGQMTALCVQGMRLFLAGCDPGWLGARPWVAWGALRPVGCSIGKEGLQVSSFANLMLGPWGRRRGACSGQRPAS